MAEYCVAYGRRRGGGGRKKRKKAVLEIRQHSNVSILCTGQSL